MIVRNGSRVVFTDQFRAGSVDQFLNCVETCILGGFRGLVFDFSAISAAWPDSMVPLIATADWLRRKGHTVAVVLPKEAGVRGLFVETSWAHYLDPETYERPTSDPDGFRMRRFANSTEQQAAVNEFMKLVVGKLHPSKDVLTALEWSINEITDNVLTHADSNAGGLIQILSVPDPGGIIFCVADSGRGILASLREGHPDLASDELAIAEAVKKGVTRDTRVGQGNGLAGTLRLTTMSGGRFSIASHAGRFSVRTEGQNVIERGAPFPGTLVTGDLQMSRDLRVETALGFSMSILDYYEEEAGAMVLRLEHETREVGIGSRPAGAYIRAKCRHVLDEESTKGLILDWAGVGLVSSSFADEAVGKLFVELGPLAFGARVKHRGISPTNAGLLNKAILQRAATSAVELGLVSDTG